jgi:hypothetical protein
VQGQGGAQGPGAARRRLRHGPRRADSHSSSTRTPTTRCASPTSSCRPWSTTPTGHLKAVTDGTPSSRPCRPATSCARSPRPAGSAPTRACSSTPPSTSGTPRTTPGRINGSQPVLGVHAPRQLGLQPGQLNLLQVPRRRRRLRRRGLHARGRGHVHRQEILVGRADYPTEKIGENSRKFRQLGLGYANLGALLMALGLRLRLRRGPGLGRRHHRADDRPRLRHSARTAAAWARSPATPRTRAHAPRAAHAPRGRRPHRRHELVPAELLSPPAAALGRGVRDWARSTACATRRPRCWRPPAPSA